MKGTLIAHGKAREASITATVIRADGRVEQLGVVTYWHRNPLRRWAWHARRWLSRALKGR
jgi:hypothetical protein